MVQLTVGTAPDEASLRRTATDIQRRFDRVGEDAAESMMNNFAAGVRTGSAKVDKAMSSALDATGRLRVEQSKLDDLLASGNDNRQKLIQQSERTAKARRDEELAIRRAADAYKEYGQSAETAGREGSSSFLGGLRAGVAGAGGIGADFADGLAGGFAGASSLGGMGSGLLRAGGWVTAGVVAGKVFGDAVADGLATLQMQDIFQARMGLDEASMGQYADAAGRAYANNFGASVAENLTAAQSALRGGLVDADATEAEVQRVIEQIQGLAVIGESTPAELSRSMATLMRTGMAGSLNEASDIITAGFQSGLDVSGDWLDTVNEYSTQFRKFGLDASQVLTLLNQGMEGGARDTDKVADSLKEFSIRAVDGSKLTKEGFEALGFSADDLSQRFAAGGESARVALDAVIDAIQRTEDPMEQALIWQSLFGTQFEDMGDAINRFNLDPAANEFVDLQGASDRAMSTATDNAISKWEQAKRGIVQRITDIKTELADLVDPVVEGFLDKIIAATKAAPQLGPNGEYTGEAGAPGVPIFPAGPMGPSVVAPGLPAGAPTPGGNPLDIITGAGAPVPPPAPGAPPRSANEYYKQLYPQAPPADPAAATAPVDAPVAGDRTPMPRGDDEKTSGSGKTSFSESLWSLDSVPLGSFAGEEGLAAVLAGATPTTAPGQVTYGTGGDPTGKPGYGHYVVDPQKVFDAETSVMSAQTRLQNDRIKHLEVMADADATEQDKYNARMALVQSGRSLQSAEMKLIEAQQGTWKKLQDTADSFASGMGQIGSALDADFGLGDGIAGFVENLTKAAANLAAAPVIGALTGVQIGLGYPGDAAGSGMMGMLGGSGALGSQYQVAPTGYGLTPGANGIGPAALIPGVTGSNPNVDAMLTLARTVSGKVDYAPASDLINGLADCSGSISDLYEALTTGKTSAARMFTTTNFASDAEAAKLGFRPGYMPGALNVGVNPYPGQSGHMAATLPNGVNFEGGGGTGGGAQYGGNAAGALDPQFEKQYYFPIPASGGSAVPATSAAPVTPQVPAAPVNPQAAAMPSSTTLTVPDLVMPGAGADLYGPANTNPGLTGPGGAPGLSGVPTMSGGGLPGIGMPQSMPGLGGPGGMPSPFGAPSGPPTSSVIPGQGSTGAPGGGGFQGMGGLPMDGIMTAIGGAGLAIDAMAPGAGQVAAAAAKTGVQLINRSIGFAGQAAGIAASGLLETFLVSGSGGKNTDPLRTLPGRVLAGFAGARPATAPTAGQNQQAQTADQQQQQQGQQQGPGGGPLVNIEAVHQAPGQSPDSVANGVADQFRSAEISGGWHSR